MKFENESVLWPLQCVCFFVFVSEGGAGLGRGAQTREKAGRKQRKYRSCERVLGD